MSDCEGRIDIARAKRQNSIVGDPLIAPAFSSYPEGAIVDYICLICGSVMCSHDEYSSCWRVLMPKWKLFVYDWCQRIMWKIEG